MDMDMEMDVPLPDELELLEESYRFHEDDGFDPYPYESGDEQPSGDSPPSPATLIKGLKRPRPSDGADEASDEKRGRIDGEEEDEAWLRYSPSKASDPAEEERRGGDSAVEKFVWRFASEIDGDFFPVTAPSGGDRVYAKISRAAEGVERRENLDARVRSGGKV